MGCGKSSLATEDREGDLDAIPALGKNEKKYQPVDEGQCVLTDNVPGSILDKQQLPLDTRTKSTVKANTADIKDHRLGTREMKFKTEIVLDKSEKINEKDSSGLSEDEESDDDVLITEVGIQKENILSPYQKQEVSHLSLPDN